METTSYPLTRKSEDGRMVVELSEDFTVQRMTHLRADMTDDNVELIRYTPDFSLQFRFSAAEADAFVAAWTQFRESQRQAEMAEVQSEEDMEARALSLAIEHPEIDLVHKGSVEQGAYWWSAPSVGTYFRNYAYTPGDLLAQVETCVDVLKAPHKGHHKADHRPSLETDSWQ